jgi:ATP-dependent DNA helicase RecG
MPKIEAADGGVKVTFLGKNTQNEQKSTQKGTLKGTKKTTEKTTEKILKAIRNNPFVTNKEMAQICGITVDGVYWNTRKLKSQGRIRRIGGDKGGCWEVVENDTKQ